MTSDSERREMVKHLRGQAEAWRNLMPDIRMSDSRLTYSIHMAFGLNDTNITVHEALDMLADLIDRPTTTRHGKFKTKYGGETPCCEVCGYSIGDMRWNYCPKCGEVITDAKR